MSGIELICALVSMNATSRSADSRRAVSEVRKIYHILFRHGDRTCETEERYATDPYDKIFGEYGYGQLTKVGMKREYEIGQVLRQLYDSFLGEYRPDKVHAYSTDYDRTKMSLQLVLAGLYPPSSRTSWNDDIQWSPVATHYDPIPTNFLSTTNGCVRFSQLTREAEKSPEILKRMEKYKDFIARLKVSTKISKQEITNVSRIQQNLRAALSMGLPLPDWCSESDYKLLEEILVVHWDTLTHSDFMKKISAGSMIERFLKNMKDAESKKKVQLYSAHDTNVAVFARAHEFTDIPEHPDYGSAIIIEKLRGRDGQAYVRMLLWTGVDKRLLPLNIKNCSYLCPLSEYEKIVSKILPDDDVRVFCERT